MSAVKRSSTKSIATFIMLLGLGVWWMQNVLLLPPVTFCDDTLCKRFGLIAAQPSDMCFAAGGAVLMHTCHIKDKKRRRRRLKSPGVNIILTPVNHDLKLHSCGACSDGTF